MSKELKINLEHPRFNDEFFGFKKLSSPPKLSIILKASLKGHDFNEL